MREATEERDREYPNGGPVLNHRPTDEELMKKILMHALDKCIVPSIHQYYNTLLETKNKNVSFEEIFEELHHLALTANHATGAKRKFEKSEDRSASSSTGSSEDRYHIPTSQSVHIVYGQTEEGQAGMPKLRQ